MRILITSITIFILLSTRLVAQNDVRNTRWGMTIDEVIKSEGRVPDKEDVGYYKEKELIYDFSVENRILNCTFIFTNNRLSGVTYRYSWGEWQSSTDHHFSNRFYSMSKLFETLKQKKYISKYGWHMLNEIYTERGKSLTKCLGNYKFLRDLNSVNMEVVEDCYNKYADFGDNGTMYAQIDFENERTKALVKFPLKNHNFKDTFIGWVTFKAKQNSSSEF